MSVATDLFRRWNLVADIIRLAIASGRVNNIAHRVNLVLVSQPGKGKTTGILRGMGLPGVAVATDISPRGVDLLLQRAKAGWLSTVLIPDFGSIINRKYETARQTVSMIATACAEGVYDVMVAGRQREFDGTGFNIITAITADDLVEGFNVLTRNGFTTRVILVDMDLDLAELQAMWERKHIKGDRRLLSPLSFKGFYANGKAPLRSIKVSVTYYQQVLDWWKLMADKAPEFMYGFRTPDMLIGMLQASAYLRGSWRVTRADVKVVERLQTLWIKQVKVQKRQGT
ncbi:MAG: hypothetical protein V3T65_06990 [Acidobacteriota bacterium]